SGGFVVIGVFGLDLGLVVLFDFLVFFVLFGLVEDVVLLGLGQSAGGGDEGLGLLAGEGGDALDLVVDVGQIVIDQDIDGEALLLLQTHQVAALLVEDIEGHSA